MGRRTSRIWWWSALVAVLVASWPRPTGADIEPRDGTAAFTDLTGGGACSFPGEPADNLHVGISSREFGTADVCGAYLDVVGPKGSVRVQITDHCRNCPAGLLDVTRKAFTQIADVGAGRVPVSYALARNPPLTAPISLRMKGGSSVWWLQVQVLDHGNALASVELATGPPGAPNGWRALVRSADNYWTATNPGPGDGPYTLRITDIYGQNVVIYDVALAPDQIQHTVARLYQPTPRATPSTTSAPAAVVPLPRPETPPTSAESEPPAGSDAASRPRPTSDGGSTNGPGTLVPMLAVLATMALAIWLYLRHQQGRLHPRSRSWRRESPW